MGLDHIKKHKIFSDEKIKADIELTKQMPTLDEKSSSVMSRSTIRVLLYNHNRDLNLKIKVSQI